MMNKNVIVVGYGSIGKRHVKNLLSLGINPYVITAYPEKSDNIKFISSLDACRESQYGIICTPTSHHFSDFVRLIEKTNCRNILIEKPLTASLKDAQEIKKIADSHNVNVYIAYNMRFIKAFELIKQCIDIHRKEFRLVKIHAGQYLPEWRIYKDYRKSYSAHRDSGGGVDLDLSHEIDYMLWLLGFPKNILFTLNTKISALDIDSPDYFKGIYGYQGFLADVELDYIRKIDRQLLILGENTDILRVDFIKKTMKIMDKDIDGNDLFDFEKGYIDEFKEFLELSGRNKICSIIEAINVLRLLGLE